MKKTNRTSVVLIGLENKLVDKKQQDVYTFSSSDYPNSVLYAVKRWVKVTKEGPEESFFALPEPVEKPNQPDVP